MAPPLMAILAATASLIPTSAGALRYKKLNAAMKVYWLLCALSSVEIGGEFALALRHVNNIFLSNAALALETVFISLVYALALDAKIARRVIVALGALFTSIWVVNVVFFQDPNQFNEEMAIASRIFILALSIIALHTVAGRTTTSLTDEPLFWITTGNILYASGVIFLLGLSNELLQMGTSYFTAAWDVNWSLTIVADIFFAKGLLCKATSPT